MTTSVTPRLGLRVLYTLTETDAREIREKRVAAGRTARTGNDAQEGDTYPAIIVRDWAEGGYPRGYALNLLAKHGFDSSFVPPRSDEERAALSTRGDGATSEAARFRHLLDETRAQASVNLQVFLDGNDTHWVTSRSEFDPEVHGKRALLEGGHGQDVEGDFVPDPKGHWTAAPAAW